MVKMVKPKEEFSFLTPQIHRISWRLCWYLGLLCLKKVKGQEFTCLSTDTVYYVSIPTELIALLFTLRS
jgi:hypothetical protein